MLIARSTCSKSGGEFGNDTFRSPLARIREPQLKRTRFGLVTSKIVHGQPVTKGEACYRFFFNERLGGAGGPGWLGAARGARQAEEPGRSLWVDKIQRFRRKHKAFAAHWEVGRVRSSEEGSNDPGAKGRGCRLAFIKTRSSA